MKKKIFKAKIPIEGVMLMRQHKVVPMGKGEGYNRKAENKEVLNRIREVYHA